MNKRLAEIILILLDHSDFITIEVISQRLDVSSRTIRNDLKELDTILPPLGLSLIKKTGMGILLSGSEQNKLKVYDDFKHSKLEQKIESPQDRHHYILMKLASNPTCRIYEFAEDLFVSRSTINNDLAIVTEFLKSYRIELDRSNTLGLSLKGKERDIRSMLFDICLSTGSNTFDAILKQRDEVCNGAYVFQGFDLTDDEIYHFINVSKIKYINSLASLSVKTLSQILIHLLIVTIRTQGSNPIKLSDTFIAELDEQHFQDEARTLLHNIGEAFSLNFAKNEVHYIQVHILAVQQNHHSDNTIEINQFVNHLLDHWSTTLSLPLKDDVQLKQRLLNHMIPVYTRIEHNIVVENDLMHEIKTRYINTYNVVSNSIKDLPFWNQMRADDIGFITLHLAAALEKNKEKLKTLLVYSTTIGATSLLKMKITNSISEIDIIETISLSKFDRNVHFTFDLIISTADINVPGVPCIIINSILNETDLKRLKDTVQPLYKDKNNPSKNA